jgi:hypothetical protein
MDTTYIGKKKVENVEIVDGMAYVTFKKDDKMCITEPLFNLIKTTDLQDGDLIDIICAKVALKWSLELGDYAFPVKSVDRLTNHLINIINNKFSESVGKKFGYKDDSEMTVKDILS